MVYNLVILVYGFNDFFTASALCHFLGAGELAKILRFLDGSTHLYMRVCPSVRRMVGPSVRRSVRNLFFSNVKNGQFSLGKSSGQSKFDIAECSECA